MKVIFIGDVVGSPGRRLLADALPALRRAHGADFTIVNGENAAGGHGLTAKIAAEFFSLGVDVITSGNHIWDQKEIYAFLDEEPRVLRPHNYPPTVPGTGIARIDKGDGRKLAVLNLQGRIFMPPTDCPFRIADQALDSLAGWPVFVDFHAEATSEKKAMGHYLDGRAIACVGTHTHVPTADETVLPGGTAYQTDAGMTGSFDSSLGCTWDSVLPKFLTGLPSRFQVAEDDLRLCGLVVTYDSQMLVATDVLRLMVKDGDVSSLEG